VGIEEVIIAVVSHPLTFICCAGQELHTVELFHLRDGSRVPVRVGERSVGAGPDPDSVIVVIPQSRPPVGELRLAQSEHPLSSSHDLDCQLLVLSAMDLNQLTLGTKDLPTPSNGLLVIIKSVRFV